MADTARALEEYLRDLRGRLHRIPDGEVSEIVAELRSHIVDRASSDGVMTDAGVTLALERLGSAKELASLYETESLLTLAERSRSPRLLFRSLWRWTTFSVAGGFALLGVVVGYAFAASFFLAALVKPFAPSRVGLWRLAGDEISLRLGLVDAPPLSGEELLGWWIVPAGLLAGAAMLWLTPRFARWTIHRFRRTLIVPIRRESTEP